MQYIATLIMEEHYILEIEADSLEQAREIADATDLNDWKETGLITNSLDVELV